MSEAPHIVVTRQSWGSRLGAAFKGILFGLVLLVVAVVLLWWNEGRAVRRAAALSEGAGVVVPATAERVDPGNEGRLVHLTGRATTDELLRDEAFGVAVQAIHLERQVEMYQWREVESSTTEKKLGGGTETTTAYRYEKDWAPRPIDSGSFEVPAGHQNPGGMPYERRAVAAQEVTVGAFRLSSSLIAALSGWQPLSVDSLRGLPGELRWRAHLHDGGIYLGRSPAAPEVGDVRVRFRVVRPSLVSIVARQTGDGLGPYATSNGGSVELLRSGSVPAQVMFQSAQKANKVTSWIYRLVGFLLMVFGIKRVLRPLSVMADVLPALGNAVEAGAGLVAYLVGGGLATVTIAVAWLYHRPVLAVTLLLLAGAALAAAVIAFAVLWRRAGRPAAVPPPPPVAAPG